MLTYPHLSTTHIIRNQRLLSLERAQGPCPLPTITSMTILQQWLELPYAHSSHFIASLSSQENMCVDLPVWIRIHTSHLQCVSCDTLLDAICKRYESLHGTYTITRQHVLLSHVCQLVRSPRQHKGRTGYRTIPVQAGS